MNRTNWQHALIAATMMLTTWAILTLFTIPGAAMIAFAIPATWFLARECTSHEYRLGIARGWRWGKKLPVRWWEGIGRGWTRDSMFDWITPRAGLPAAALRALATTGTDLTWTKTTATELHHRSPPCAGFLLFERRDSKNWRVNSGARP